MDDPHVRIEDTYHLVILAADHAKIGDLLELQHFREEVRCPVNIRNREAYHFDPLHLAGQTVARMANMARECHQ